jgi:hypothetical protein
MITDEPITSDMSRGKFLSLFFLFLR